LIAPVVLLLSLLPLTAVGSTVAPAGQPNALGFRILLSDGSILKGSVSFTLDIDTPYGRLTVPSTNFLSGRFHIADQRAEIYTRGIELRVQYNPASSDLKATTDAGPVSVDLTKVVSIETLYAEVPNAAPAAASNPAYQEAPPAVPSVVYDNTPPAPVAEATPYDYGDYGAVAPVYANPGWFGPQPYGYPYDYLYGYPYGYSYAWCPGYGFIAVSSFNRNHYRREWGYGGQFHNAAGGRAFSSVSFRSTPSPTFRSATPAFRSAGSVFRSAAAPTFRSGATATFHSGGGGSFRSGGAQFGGAGGRGR
jgi:hypothetical protein